MEKYYLAGNEFLVEVSSFGIHTIQPVKQTSSTRWIRKDELYGTIEIKYLVGNDEKTLTPHDPAEKSRPLNVGSVVPIDADLTPYPQTAGHYHRTQLNSTVSFQHSTPELTAEIAYCVQGETFTQKMTLTNTTTEPIEITDLSAFFPSDATALWEEDTAEKVIAHNFVGGHGSFLMLKRCDGLAPHLLMLPFGETKFEYWEPKKGSFAFIEENKDTFVNIVPECHPNLFIHSKTTGGIADEKGNRLWKKHSSLVLEPGEAVTYGWNFFWVADDEQARQVLADNDSWDVQSVPGYTVPTDLTVRLALRGNDPTARLLAEFPESTSIKKMSSNGAYQCYELKFDTLGENTLTLLYDDGKKWLDIRYFITEPCNVMLEKRADFLVKQQYNDDSKWYNGLLCDWDSDAEKRVTPDEHDRLNGWFVYTITSDDPGLAKPTFLSSKIAETPIQSQVDAMENYIEYFVWGGLQNRDDEAYPYGIYGIPNWYENRNSDNPGTGYSLDTGQKHIWRIYDYPHIVLMYYNMYRLAKNYPTIQTRLSAETYLERAYRTAIALFTYPLALDGWSADSLGLYSEVCLPDLIDALKKNHKNDWAFELESHWSRKTKYFVTKLQDLFVSEQPMDTTDFESSHALAKYALEHASIATEYRAHEKDVFSRRNNITFFEAMKFMEEQITDNIACRGTIEPAYFWFGSDYRGRNSAYTLSYMSQMGGWSILDYALYYAADPFSFLRLGYGSALSSWALLNSGDEKSNYGYWYPGSQNDGAAGGGFEPAPYGRTWFDQPHSGGSWYYSAEIDLGFSGGIRCMATILAADPIFGWTVYGGNLESNNAEFLIDSREAVRRRLHLVGKDQRCHVLLDRGKFSESSPIIVKQDFSKITLPLDLMGAADATIELKFSTTKSQQEPSLHFDGELVQVAKNDQTTIYTLRFNEEQPVVTIDLGE